MSNVKIVAWVTGIFFLLTVDFLALRVALPALVSSTDWLLVGLGALGSLFLVWVHVVVGLVLVNKFWKDLEDDTDEIGY